MAKAWLERMRSTLIRTRKISDSPLAIGLTPDAAHRLASLEVGVFERSALDDRARSLKFELRIDTLIFGLPPISQHPRQQADYCQAMPRSHPVELGSRTFPSKTVAKTYIRTEILHGYAIGVPISNPEHIAVLLDALRRKENAAEKIGGGIDYFFVELTSRFRNYVQPDARTLAIRHTNPSEQDVDFGYESAIDDSTEVDHAKEALRYAVADLRDEFKFAQFAGGATPLGADGAPISKHEDSEVRYENPDWGKLTADFADTVGGWAAIETHSGDGQGAQIGRRLISGYVQGQWRDYYSAYANPVLHRKRGA